MSTRKAINVSMTPEWERSVLKRITTGRYRTSSEVVISAALLLLDKDEPLDPVRLRSPGWKKENHVGAS